MTETLKTFKKDPNSVIDYTLDWAAWLDTDTISSSSWTGDGVTISSSSDTSTTATAFVSGGTVNTQATATCQVVTAGGRTDERSIAIQIRDL